MDVACFAAENWPQTRITLGSLKWSELDTQTFIEKQFPYCLQWLRFKEWQNMHFLYCQNTYAFYWETIIAVLPPLYCRPASGSILYLNDVLVTWTMCFYNNVNKKLLKLMIILNVNNQKIGKKKKKSGYIHNWLCTQFLFGYEHDRDESRPTYMT